MLRLGKKRDGQNRTIPFESVKKACDVGLQKWADYLSKKAKKIPEQTLARTLIVIFMTIALALTCRLVYSYKHRSRLQFPAIRAPAPTHTYRPSADALVLKRIRHFHHYLDSIHLNDEPVYDSLTQQRPHLIDSIIIIERLIKE